MGVGIFCLGVVIGVRVGFGLCVLDLVIVSIVVVDRDC